MTKKDIDKCIDELDKEYNDKMEKLLTMKQETKEVTDLVKWTPEQVKAHRREVFEAFDSGKVCEWRNDAGKWCSVGVLALGTWLFGPEPWRVRVKPEVKEPRKCWVRWSDDGHGDPLVIWNVRDERCLREDGWQLVTENVKAQ